MKNNKYILYAISFLQALVFYGAYSVSFRESRGLELSDIFVLESILIAFIIIFEVPWGIIGDRIGYKKTLIISYGLLLISSIVFYKSYSFLGFLIEAIILSIAISGMSGCDSALLYSSIDKSESNKVFGIYRAMGTIGFLVASLTSGIIIRYSMDLLAFATVIAYTALFLLSFALKDIKSEDNEEGRESILKSLKFAITNKKIIIFVISIAVLSETTHSICVFFNQPLYIKSGIDIKWFGILAAFMQVSALIAIKADKVKKKFGEKNLLNGALVVVILSNFFIVRSNMAFLTIALIFMIEGAFALTEPITETIKNESIKSKNRATILSAYAMIGNIVASVVNIVISLASSLSLEISLLVCLFLNIASILIMRIYLRSENKSLLLSES